MNKQIYNQTRQAVFLRICFLYSVGTFETTVKVTDYENEFTRLTAKGAKFTIAYSMDKGVVLEYKKGQTEACYFVETASDIRNYCNAIFRLAGEEAKADERLSRQVDDYQANEAADAFDAEYEFKETETPGVYRNQAGDEYDERGD